MIIIARGSCVIPHGRFTKSNYSEIVACSSTTHKGDTYGVLIVGLTYNEN